MENEIDDGEFDYLMSLANEELKNHIPNFSNLKVDSDKNYSCAESFFLPEARDSDSDSDLSFSIEGMATNFLTQL